MKPGGPGAACRYRDRVDLQTVKNLATVGIIAFVAIGLLLAIIIKKIIGKVISLVLAAVVVFVVWQQRGNVEDRANAVRDKVCISEPSFFGVGVALPDGWCERR